MPFLTSLYSWFNTKRLHQIELFQKFPFEVQQETLFKLLNKAKCTEYGVKYDYESMKEIKDFQERVPIVDYEGIKPYIDKHREGTQNVLWPGAIKWFAKSSGTTSNKSKFIPVSSEALEDCHFRGGRDVLAIYTNLHPETEIFAGKGLTLGGSHRIDNYNIDSLVG
jgi:hypothetical protein